MGAIMPQQGENGTAANHFLTALYRQSKRIGVDADAILQQLNIPLNIIDKPNVRVPSELVAQYQKAMWDLLGDESMRQCRYPIKSGTFNLMGKLTVHQPTLEKALRLGARFYNLVVHDDFITLRQEGGNAILAVTILEPELDPEYLFSEIFLLAWHRFASWLIADAIPLTETRFFYPAPRHVSEYAYLYPGVHKFECNELAIVFPTRYLANPVKQTEASLKSFMERCPLELFRHFEADYSLSTELKRMLARDLANCDASIDTFAELLHMNRRTLMRKLKDEGTSFQKIKDIVRRDKAIYLLANQSVPINKIAESIGYSDPAVFTRAFRGWSGISPREYREKHRASPVTNM